MHPLIVAALISGGLGLAGNLFGGGRGEEIEYQPQISPEEQAFRKKLMDYLGPKIGQPATPYGGPLTAPVNPMMLAGMNMASQYYTGQPYQHPEFGTMADYMPQAQQPPTPKKAPERLRERPQRPGMPIQ